jgi:hypothetical protein
MLEHAAALVLFIASVEAFTLDGSSLLWPAAAAFSSGAPSTKLREETSCVNAITADSESLDTTASEAIANEAASEVWLVPDCANMTTEKTARKVTKLFLNHGSYGFQGFGASVNQTVRRHMKW